MAVPRLVEMLDDTDPPVRSAAVWALVLIDAPEHSLPRVRAMLEDPDANCRQRASEGLGYLEHMRAKKSADGEASPAR